MAERGWTQRLRHTESLAIIGAALPEADAQLLLNPVGGLIYPIARFTARLISKFPLMQ
jgi:hypothetical protein